MVGGLAQVPALAVEDRPRYFIGFSLACVAAATLGTALGYYASLAMPRPLTLGLVFLNPIYYALVFAALRERAALMALIAGVALGPLLFLVSPDWSVLVTGIAAGTCAYLADRTIRRRHEHR